MEAIAAFMVLLHFVGRCGILNSVKPSADRKITVEEIPEDLPADECYEVVAMHAAGKWVVVVIREKVPGPGH
jgi:hypothetical protein